MRLFNFSRFLFGGLLAALTLVSPVAAQQQTIIKFTAGNDNAAAEGSIKGKQFQDYILGAKAGQKLGVSLTTKGTAYFNILPPGSNDVAIYNSSIDGNDAVNVVLPADGNYSIRVYLMGNDESANKTVSYVVSTVIMN